MDTNLAAQLTSGATGVISSSATSVTTVLVAMFGIVGLFVVYRLVRKAMGR